jgi:hypothetical protein
MRRLAQSLSRLTPVYSLPDAAVVSNSYELTKDLRQVCLTPAETRLKPLFTQKAEIVASVLRSLRNHKIQEAR